MNTIHGVLERNARKFPKKEAFICGTARLTYADMNSRANQFARLLMQRGIKKNEQVAILSRNNENYFFAYFALLKAGAIPVPLNTKLNVKEVLSVIDRMDCRGILYEGLFHPCLTPDEESSLLSFPIEQGVTDSKACSPVNLNLSIKATDVCEIMLTSGTTGLPKGVMLTHAQVSSVALGIAIEFHLSHNDRILSQMPLSHSAPLNCFFMGGLYCGASHVLGDFTPQNFLQRIHQEKTTFTFASPIAYLLAAKEPSLSNYDLSSMRVFAYGGGAMPLASYHFVTKAFHNKNFYQVYGLTEAGPNGSLLRPEEHEHKPGSIGKTPVVNMEMKVINDDGTETAPGEYGEIILAGDSVMSGYFNNKDATDDILREGWIYSGDIAYRDEDGYLFIVDRKKDMIIPGGVNVYPREIEETLTKHPDVLQACVVGIQDQEWGETIKAVIVRKEDSEVSEGELRSFLSVHLAEYKCPRTYSFVTELPYNANGKILKQLVKEM
ncbi:AMP-binding protein [Fictibacillus sp. WQ 8-8]|uniref:class I adenylate-forming enzyme family protein n=1 Tax=Fictibacillus sp. WQ 8-8 TaxID=2938788 RepID=UPI00210A3BD6|nr:AMP-binding protein [Fictibacillus sp. WQ 8-8]MCQ6267936.1 AMP-binding protein [Fictibacillus sp. WQ 8-8]